MSTKRDNQTIDELELPPKFAHLERQLREMIHKTIANASDLKLSKDKSFGDLAAIAGFVRSSQSGEGYLIENGAAALIKATKRFLVLKDIRVPGEPDRDDAGEEFIAPAALKKKGKKPDKRGYRPDLVLIDRNTHEVFMIEVKRTSESYLGWQLARLAKRMAGCSAGLLSILKSRYPQLEIRSIDVIILDASDSDTNAVVTRISSLDDILGIDGLANAIGWLRQEYAIAVQQAFLIKLSPFYARLAKLAGKPSVALVREADLDARMEQLPDPDDDDQFGKFPRRPQVRIIGNLS